MVNPAPGVLLIADPFLKDPNFMRTVVFLTEANDEDVRYRSSPSIPSKYDVILPPKESAPDAFGGRTKRFGDFMVCDYACASFMRVYETANFTSSR